MAIPVTYLPGHLVQTSNDFSSWTTETTVMCEECSEGAGQFAGDATLTRRFGSVRQPGDAGSPSTVLPYAGSILGRWVRILIEDSGGTIVVGSTNYKALWHGIVETMTQREDGGINGAQSFGCIGLIGALARVRLSYGFALSSSGTSAGAIFRVPAFNTPGIGGRSSSTLPFGYGGASAYVFDGSSQLQWTAKQIIDYLLASHAKPYIPGVGFIGSIGWTLSAGSLLDYIPDAIDVNGLTLLDAINALINARRGLTYRVTVSGTTATINVQSTAASAITVTSAAGTYTLSASTDTTAPDLTGIESSDVNIHEYQSETYDQIQVIGARPIVAMTLMYDPAGATSAAKSLVAGWQSADETSWASGATPGKNTTDVWRYFKVGPTWDGRGYYSGSGTFAGVRNKEAVDANGDATGSRSFSSSDPFSPYTVDILTTTPAFPGASLSNNAAPWADAFLVYLPQSATQWRSCTAPTAFELRPPIRRSVEAATPVPGIRIGDPGEDQAANKYLFSNGFILATVAVREPDPLFMTWTAPSANWPRTTPRVLVYHLPNCEQWCILPGTVVDINSSGVLQRQADAVNADTSEKETFVRDDRPQMRSVLAFLRAYYTTPARALSWHVRGSIDLAYGSGASAPGALVTTATLGSGSMTINAVVTRRRWTLSQSGFGTSYETERAVPDIEAIK